MSKSLSIEEKLVQYFQPEELEKAFREYKEAKQDFFSSDIVKISMGSDGISFKTFEKELSLRCSFISRRVLNGTYRFYPFREINIPKEPNIPESPPNERVLSIATIRDILVQKKLYETVYEDVENLFNTTRKLDRVSCAYRRGKSAPYAAKLIHQYINQGFKFVLDADIVKFFDEIPHYRLLVLIKNSFGESSLVSKLLLRFVKTGGLPYRDDNKKPYKQSYFHHKKVCMKRIKGIPQGGILSGMLANLYLNEFDRWVVNDLSRQYKLRYVRYADDFVILLKEESAVTQIHDKISQKLEGIELKLHSLDSNKTRHLNVTKNKLEFVGFELTPENIRIRSKNIEKFKERVLEKIAQEPNYWDKVTNPKRRLELFVDKIINRKILGRGEAICQICGGVIDEQVKSWIGFFSAITDTAQLHDLDKWIRQEVSAHFYREYGFRVRRAYFGKKDISIEESIASREYLASLEQEYYRLHKSKFNLCSCAISNKCSDSEAESA